MFVIRKSDGLVLHADATHLDAEGARGMSWVDRTITAATADLRERDGQTPAGASINWTFVAGVWTPPPVDLEALRLTMLDELADVRWRHETGGALIGGSLIPSDRQTTAILTAAYVTAREDPNFTIRFKMGRAAFVTLNAETIIALATGVRLHVQACFDREDELTSEIMAAGNVAALAAVDVQGGWPN